MSMIRRIIPILSSPYVALILRLTVGGIFVFSGITKLPMHSQFVAIVKSYHLLPDPMATAYALALPWAELLVGAYLLLGILLKPSAVATILIGMSFMVANVNETVQGKQYCGSCFGEAIPLLVSQALTIDIIIITTGFILLMAKGERQILGFDSWFAHRQCV